MHIDFNAALASINTFKYLLPHSDRDRDHRDLDYKDRDRRDRDNREKDRPRKSDGPVVRSILINIGLNTYKII